MSENKTSKSKSTILAFRLYENERFGTKVLFLRRPGGIEKIDLDTGKGPLSTNLSWEEYALELEKKGQPTMRYPLDKD